MAAGERQPSRLRRWLRRGLRIALGLFLALLLLLGGVFAFLRSSWGQAKLLAWIVPVVQGSLTGRLQVARLHTDLFHQLSLEGIDLADGGGQPAVHVDRLTVRYDLAPLRQRTLQITAVELVGGRVSARHLADGQINLATLVKPSPEPAQKSSAPLPLRIVVDGIQVGAALAYAGPPGPLSQVAADLTLAASVHIEPDLRIALRIDRLDLPTTQPLKSQLSLRGGVGLVLAKTHNPADAGAAPGLPDLSLADVVLSLKTDAAEISRVLPGAGLLPGALRGELKLSGGLSMLTSILDIALPRGAIKLQASVGFLDEKLPWKAALQLVGIELASLRSDLPPVRVECALAGEGAMASGQLEVQRLDLQAGHNSLSLRGTVTAPATPAIWQDPLAATAQLALSINAPRLDELRATHALLPVLHGSLIGKVLLDLKDRVPRVTTQLDGSNLAGFGAQLARLHVDIDSPDVLGLRGRVKVSLTEARYGAEQIARATLSVNGSNRDLSLGADVQGRIAGQSLQVHLALSAQPSYAEGQGLRPQAVTAQIREFSLLRGRDRLELLTPANVSVSELATAPVIELPETLLPAALRQRGSSAAPDAQPRTKSGLSLRLGDLRLFLSGRYEVGTGRVAGQLGLENIDAQQLVFAATGRTDVPRSHLDAELRINGTLTQPSGTAHLSGTVDPLPGVVPWEAPLSLQVDVSGTPQNPQGSVSLTVPTWQLDRLRGDGATLTLRYADRHLQAKVKVPRVTTEQPPIGTVVVGGDVDVDWRDETLAVTTALTWGGEPWIRAQAGSKLSIAAALADSAGLIARLPTLPLTATLDMPAFKLPAGLPATGQLGLHAEFHGSLSAPNVTARVLASDVQAGTWKVGSIAMYAALDAKKQLALQALLDPGGAAPALPLQPRPTAASLAPGVLLLLADVPLPVALTKPGLTAQLIAKGYRLDYQPQVPGTGSLRSARGRLDADLLIESASPQPVFQGSLRLADGEVAATTLPQLLREISLAIELGRDGRIALQDLSAKAGRGSLKAQGLIDLKDGQLRTLSLQSRANNFPVAAGAYSVWLSTQINISGQNDGQTLRTHIDIPRGQIDVPKLSSGNDVQALGPLADVEFVDAAGRKARDALLAAQAQERKEREEREEAGDQKAVPFLPPHTLVDVDMPGPFVINGPEVKTDLQGHLRAELNSEGSSRGDPIIHGDLHALNGWLEILGRRYQIDRAQVSMSGETPPNPLLDISISRKVEDATIYILVTGSAKKPVISFRSDPATYDQGQIIAMVLSGSSRGGGSIQQQALGALSSLVVGKLKDQLGAAVPVDVIKFDVGGNDAMGANQSSLEIGKYLRDNLYLSYTHRFGNPSTILRRMNNDQVALEWWFLRNYQIHLMGGDQGVGSLNLYWNKRF